MHASDRLFFLKSEPWRMCVDTATKLVTKKPPPPVWVSQRDSLGADGPSIGAICRSAPSAGYYYE